MAEESRARFRHEDIAAVPKGWRVRTVVHSGSGHRVRVAFPPGRKQKGSGRLISILHPTSGQNPCVNPCTLKSANPAELMVMSANPPRTRVRLPGAHVETYMRVSAITGKKIGKATKVVFADGKEIKFLERVPKRLALREAARQLQMGNPASEPEGGYFSEVIEAGSRRIVIWANSSAGPFHVQPYVNYGETATSQVGKYKTLEMARKKAHAFISKMGWAQANPTPELLVMGANPTVAANPIAAELYEQFHGREPRWETIDAEPHMPKGDYAKLGDLVGLTVKPAGGGQVQTIQWFHGSYDIENYSQSLLPLIDAPWVVSDEAGQIYFYKGNQTIPKDGAAFYFPHRRDGDVLELGEVRIIRYRARKSHDNEELLDYVHRFGEESGIRPKVLYDSRLKRLLLEGGNYRIEAPGIID